ncbi:MAG: hypothetical protein ACI8QZ_000545 [Chlamydiales bacterium]|jgi:hypothetical protein
MSADFRLRQLPFAMRLGLSCVLLVLLGGFLASGLYMAQHHENRDERPGLTMDDIEGHYHGVRTPSALRDALAAGHPTELSAPSRATLLTWLNGDRISEDYDNLDLGDQAPAEILASACTSCHSRNADDPIGESMPLEYWDDIKRVAFASTIEPVSTEILLASTHTHALALGTVTLLLMMLVMWTRFAAGVAPKLSALTGAALLVDLGGWWLTRSNPALVPLIVVGGALFGVGAVLLGVLVLAELWLP